MSLNLSGDIGSIITALGTVAIGVLQVLQARRSKEAARKLDENTKLTAEVHAATAAIAEQTGTHKALPPEM